MTMFHNLISYFKKNGSLSIALFLLLLSLSSLSEAGNEENIEELYKRLDILADEVDQMTIDKKEQRVHLFGYGELHYTRNQGDDGLKRSPSKDTMDFHRMVIGLAVDISDWIKFSSEVDFEHGFAEPYIEFAYLDFLLHEKFNFRVGSLITPVGYINETHEPPTFYSVERPYTDRLMMPTTWPEGGAGIFGNIVPGLSYKVYAQASLTASNKKDNKRFRAKNGLRSGRYKAVEAMSDDLAVVGRLEYTGYPGLSLGASLYRGDTAQGNDSIKSGELTLWDVDARYRYKNIEMRGMYIQFNLDDASDINAKNLADGLISTGDEIGSRGVGWRGELAYHLGDLLFERREKAHKHTDWYHPGKGWQVPQGWDLVPFIRFEKINTQDQMASGYTANPKYNREVLTGGLAFFPHSDVVIKTDVERWHTGDSAYNYTQFNLGIGYMF